MKLKNYFALGLMGITLLSSCSQEAELKGEKGSVSTGKTTTFATDIQSEIEAVELHSYASDNNEARAIIYSDGYTIPRLDVTEDELGYYAKHSETAHWGVLGDSQRPQHESVSQDNVVTARLEALPNVSTIFFNAGAGAKNKNEFTFYCPVKDELNNPLTSPVDNKWAYFALGGHRKYKGADNSYSSNARYLSYFPNDKTNIVGIKKGEDSFRELPLMTDVMAFNKILGEGKEKVKFKLRGCLVGLCFINKLGEDITLEEIILPEDNALYFRGSFDMETDTDGNSFRTSTCGDTNKQARFEGENSKLTLLLEAGETVGIATKEWSQMSREDKDNSKLYYLWGMPRTEGLCYDRLKFQIKFRKGTSTKSSFTRTFHISLPKGEPFKENKAYRLPVVIENKNLVDVVGSGHNPLDYVAEYVVRKDCNDFVTDYHIPSSNYNLWNPVKDPGLFSLQASIDLFNGSKAWLDNYFLPSKEHWQSIVPLADTDIKVFPPSFRYIHWNKFHSQRNLKQDARVGLNAPVKKYESDFITISECPRYVTYALRFKGTKWESAWRYSFETNDLGQKRVVIKCVGGLQYLGKKLADISYPEFFFDNPKTTTRILPAYGRFCDVPKTGEVGLYRTSSSKDSHTAYRVLFGQAGLALHYNGNRDWGFSVLPFKKSID